MAIAVTFVACGKKKHKPAEPVTVTQTVGPSGGTVTTPDGASIDIPAGALDSNTQISITETHAAPPGVTNALSDAYVFAPEGIVFAHPVHLTLPLPSSVSAGSVFWSRLGAAGFDNLGGAVATGKVTADIVHFSIGYVGVADGTRTVIGSDVTTWVSNTSIQNIPSDLSTTTIAALIANSAGGYTVKPGSGDASGTFSIPGVPDGAYILRIGNEYVASSLSSVDLGSSVLGRADAVRLTTPTTITLDLTNLAPWVGGDALEAFSTQVNAWWFGLEYIVGQPTDGSVALSSYSFDSTTSVDGPFGSNRIEGSRGDRFTFAQLTLGTSLEGVPYQSMTRIFEPAPFDQTNGGTNAFTGAFTDVATNDTSAADLKTTQFAALLGDIHPTAPVISNGVTFSVLGQAGGLSYGPISATADFLVLYAGTAQDIAASGMHYGQPLQGTWGNIGDARVTKQVAWSVSSLSPAFVYVGIGESDEVGAFTTAPITPFVGPPRLARIGALDLNQDQIGVGLTPTISWSAPAVGTATQYDVAVFRLTPDFGNGVTRKELIANFATKGTSLTLPSGILTAGEAYALRISAQVSNDPITTPHRISFPFGIGQTATAIFRP